MLELPAPLNVHILYPNFGRDIPVVIEPIGDIVTNTIQFPYGQLNLASFDHSFNWKIDTWFSTDHSFNYELFLEGARTQVTKAVEIRYALPDPVAVTQTHQFNYGQLISMSVASRFYYGSLVPVNKVTQFSYMSLTQLERTLVCSWSLRTEVNHTYSFSYDLSPYDGVQKVSHFPYALTNNTIKQIQANPKLYSKGNEIEFINIRLSCDENSPYYIADVQLAFIKDFITLNIGYEATLEFNNDTFHYIVDSRSQSRTEGGEHYQLTLISPAALLDNPFAQTITKIYSSPTLAKQVVEDAVGSVEWNLPNWLIPIEQLQFVDVTPMAIAKKVVAAIGGLLESASNGTLIARKRFKVSVPDYAEAIPDFSLLDSDLLSVSEQIAPKQLFNRVDIYNTQISASGVSDKLEYVASTEPTIGVMHGYPHPWRDLNLIHTGNLAITITKIGEFERSESEVIEFISGKASTRYPIQTITALQWNVVNLGAVTYDGSILTSAVPAESLLKITYLVKSIKWDVVGVLGDEAQFLAEEI